MTPSFMVPLNDLAGLLSRGLQVLEVHSPLDGEPEIVADIPERLVRELDDKKPKSKLTGILETMLAAANTSPGQVQRKTLASGLGIDMIVGLDGMFRLQLWREKGKYPSLVEWRTTIDYFPIRLEGREPERFSAKGRGYLRAAWEMAKE